jgi:nicotinate-nucleotide adenylyltransferase
VLGGTFNPIHFGHLHIAQHIQRLFSLNQIYFVVSAMPPHKPLESVISLTHRYAMVSLATAEVSSFIPSLIELEPQASPFSVDTMGKLARCIARERSVLYFIAGGDSLLEVNSWRESETLLTSYNFVFAVRPGTNVADAKDLLPDRALARVQNFTGLGRIQIRRGIAEDESAGETRIYIVDVGAPDISATRIRRLVASRKPIHRMVPAPVCKYIRKLRLYGGK